MPQNYLILPFNHTVLKSNHRSLILISDPLTSSSFYRSLSWPSEIHSLGRVSLLLPFHLFLLNSAHSLLAALTFSKKFSLGQLCHVRASLLQLPLLRHSHAKQEYSQRTLLINFFWDFFFFFPHRGWYGAECWILLGAVLITQVLLSRVDTGQGCSASLPIHQ